MTSTGMKQPVSGSHFQNSRKANERQEIKKGGKPFSKLEVKELMNITVPLRVQENSIEKRVVQVPSRALRQTRNNKRFLTLEEMEEKTYLFLDSDVASMFEELLKMKFIELPEMKRPNEASMVNDPNYCKYYRLLGHPIERYFIFK